MQQSRICVYQPHAIKVGSLGWLCRVWDPEEAAFDDLDFAAAESGEMRVQVENILGWRWPLTEQEERADRYLQDLCIRSGGEQRFDSTISNMGPAGLANSAADFKKAAYVRWSNPDAFIERFLSGW